MEKYKRTYVEPEVKLISSQDNDLGMYLWLQSRNKILSNLDGSPIEVEPTLKNFKPGFKFKVGDEIVEYTEYRTRINNLNLQYNNSVFYLFEIKGSCLFRDMCYNINTTSQWAESNRFLFSILDETARFNSELYPISSEYKDIPEWESQFDKYMDTIKIDPIVDHNRLEMPYSISSRFWWGVTRAQLRYFLEFLKRLSPFFYEVYGHKFIELTGLNPDDFSNQINPLMAQYLNRGEPWNPGSDRVGNMIQLRMEMGLILYSQFIRQSGAIIQGYLDKLIHSQNNIDDFKSEVFKGDTLIKVTCTISEFKLKKTLSNRSCAFAMSSGDSPCSWNSLIKLYTDSMSLEEFKEFLPCTFYGNEIVECKFYDDVKFRNEGKEISNIPCPLVTRSLDDAIKKLQRDQNSLAEKFYSLTELQNYNGLQECYSDPNRWTSNIAIYCDQESMEECRLTEGKVPPIEFNTLDAMMFNLEGQYNNGITLDSLMELEFSEFITPADKELLTAVMGTRTDYTCIAKGLVLDYVFQTSRSKNHMTVFGGDIFTTVPQQIKIDDTNFSIKVPANTSVFTSSNIGRRGKHISTQLDRDIACTVIVTWTSGAVGDWDVKNWLVDLLATKVVAGESAAVKKILGELAPNILNITILGFDDKGRLTNPTYCASPFFNPDQVEIRDRMISKFNNVFRPDLTNSSVKYDSGDNQAVYDVVDDNIKGITESRLLVFPNRTTDLGTLYEVGYAIGSNKPIIKYDEKSDEYLILFTLEPQHFNLWYHYIFDCSKKSDCIGLGMASTIIDSGKLFKISYMLNECKDNIMLSTRHQHVELINGKYEVVERSLDERDE